MVKLLNPSMVLVFKINYFPGQMAFKFKVTYTHPPTHSAPRLLKGHNQLVA
jgi:hypothetical protein